MTGSVTGVKGLDKMVRSIVPLFEDLLFFSHTAFLLAESRPKSKDSDFADYLQYLIERLEASRVRMQELYDLVLKMGEVSNEESLDLAKKLENRLGTGVFLIMSDITVGEDLSSDLRRKSAEDSRSLQTSLDKVIGAVIELTNRVIEGFRKLEAEYT